MRDNVKTRAAQLDKFEIVMKVYLHSWVQNEKKYKCGY